MPLPGAQHTTTANPFEEPQKRIAEFTAMEIATLQSRLEKQLGPEYLSSRSGPSGQKVHYITAEKCISLANEVFGFNGWSSSIQNIQVDFVEENPQTLKVSLGLSVIVRVTLRDGTFHEDIGYGHIENCKGKAAAFEKAKKEGTTDALKRTLRNFGNVLGNCIYDKAYLAKVTKMKVEPTKFDELALHRHSDFAAKPDAAEASGWVAVARPKAQNPDLPKPNRADPPKDNNDASLLSSDSFEEFMSELDEADFNVVEDGHPDEVVLSNPQSGLGEKPHNGVQQVKAAPMQPPSRPIAKSGSNGGNITRQPHTPNQPHSRPGQFNGQQNQHQQANPGPRPQPQGLNQQSGALHTVNQTNSRHNTAQPPAQNAPPYRAQNEPPPSSEGAGFFSARAVSQLPADALVNQTIAPKANQIFNPRAESPSIRKTPGIDHTKSKPLSKSGQHVPPPSSAENSAPVANVSASVPRPAPGPNVAGGQGPMQRPGGPGSGNLGSRGSVGTPQLDHSRRIGAPMGGASPLANRGQYRPPTMKRPVGQESGAQGQGLGRPALTEMSSNNPPTAQTASEPDVKRQRVA